jgi:hypothetical protein
MKWRKSARNRLSALAISAKYIIWRSHQWLALNISKRRKSVGNGGSKKKQWRRRNSKNKLENPAKTSTMAGYNVPA